MICAKNKVVGKNKLQAGCWWLMPIIPAMWGTEIGRIAVGGQLGKILCEDPISKITRANWTAGVAQVVKCLLCKP
jgi:hypothetical protein